MKPDRFPKFVRKLLELRRESRLRAMLKTVKTWEGMHVLDIGCGIDGRSFSDHCDPSWQIAGIDLHDPVRINHKHPNFTYYQASVCDLSRFEDKQFDLAVSVVMLEHITPPDEYIAACNEIQRVTSQYVVVVPYRWGWLEPHFGFPFFGGLPKSVQRKLIRTLNLSGQRNNMDYFETMFKWRTNKQYLADFPGSKIHFMPTLETIAIIRSQQT